MKTNNCLICHEPLLKNTSLSFLFSNYHYLCESCSLKFKKLNKKEKILDIDTTFLYSYDSFAESIVYQYKGCYDYVLKDVFLDGHIHEIKAKYHGYTIVYPPSNKEDDVKRGYIHIKEIVSCLNLPIVDAFYKIKNHKQSSFSFIERNQIEKIIKLKPNIINPYNKYLVIDDIFTSGSTLKTVYSLLIKAKVKKEHIKGLILFKTSIN